MFQRYWYSVWVSTPGRKHSLAIGAGTILALTSFGAAFSTDYARFTKYATHNNWDTWFCFGPGVIRSAKTIVLTTERQQLSANDLRRAKEGQFIDPRNYVTNEGDQNFQAVKRWILDNFADKIDFSETPPSPQRARLPEKVLSLYSERTTPVAEKTRDLLLISIPISAKTLCVNEPEAEKKYRELKALMGVPPAQSGH